MKVVDTLLPGVVVIAPRVFADHRGHFFESYNRRELEALGVLGHFVQDNHSRSRRGVLRGLHYQVVRPQAKLVRVVHGEMLDVVVDVRRSSSTFGRWAATTLSAESGHMLYVPAGFAHGFVARSEWVEVAYKTSDYYSPAHERCIAWNDPDLAIDWGITAPILSAKDAAGTTLRLAEVSQ